MLTFIVVLRRHKQPRLTHLQHVLGVFDSYSVSLVSSLFLLRADLADEAAVLEDGDDEAFHVVDGVDEIKADSCLRVRCSREIL